MGETDHRLVFLQMILDSFIAEYEDLSETWRHLDSKAQGAAGIAGVFIAGIFAFLARQGSPSQPILKWLLVMTVVLLLASVIAALLALRVREVSRPPVGSEVTEEVADLLREDLLAELPERLPAFLRDRTEDWKEVNLEAVTANSSKAVALQYSQAFLIGAIVVAALFVLGVLFDP